MVQDFHHGKLKRDDCVNRVYDDGKNCNQFDVKIRDEDNEVDYEFRFYKLEDRVWFVRCVNDALPPCFSMNVIQMQFEVPNKNASLEFIASVGLRYVSMYHVELAAKASTLASMLNEVCL